MISPEVQLINPTCMTLKLKLVGGAKLIAIPLSDCKGLFSWAFFFFGSAFTPYQKQVFINSVMNNKGPKRILVNNAMNNVS